MHVRYYYVKRLVQVLTAKGCIINVAKKQVDYLIKLPEPGLRK